MTRFVTIFWLLLGLISAPHSGFAADPFWGADPTWSLLHEPAVEQELKLSPTQSLQFRTLLDGLDETFFPLRNQPRDEGSKQATAILEQAAKSLETLLSKAQFRRFAEIQVRLQGTGVRRPTTSGLRGAQDNAPRRTDRWPGQTVRDDSG
jgi:hypothetical protein